MPVILVTSVEDELDQLVGYKLGAIDYVIKPVSPKVLAAKGEVVLGPMSVDAERPVERAVGKSDVPRAEREEVPLDP